MNILRLFFICLALAVIIFPNSVAAQDDNDIQSWNEVQLNIPMGKRVDFFTRFNTRFGNDLSRFNSGRFTVGYLWKATKSLSVSPSYLYVKSRNSAGRFRPENRLSLAAVYTFPTKRFGLSHRSTYEKRMRAQSNSWRYRAMITIDKKLPESLLPNAKWFVTNEVFYSSTTDKFSRNRFSIGVTKRISKQFSLDLYYLRQNDGFSRPGDLNVVGSTWKIRL